MPAGRITGKFPGRDVERMSAADNRKFSGTILVGQTFPGVREGASGTAVRLARALKREWPGRTVKSFAKIAKKPSSESFIACDIFPEAIVFPALIRINWQQDTPDAQI
ncbi:MAG: hypothetical protein LUQ31_00480 [Methanoregula sp.]|nr:hypothetical protein [Methanoregula sp.]